MNIFERASRAKFRFSSSKGPLTVEYLWDLPLKASSGYDLDSVAKFINAELREAKEESFVSVSQDPQKAINETKLEIVKHIISVRQAENEIMRTKHARSVERARLIELLDRKQNESLAAESVDQLKARIEALDA